MSRNNLYRILSVIHIGCYIFFYIIINQLYLKVSVEIINNHSILHDNAYDLYNVKLIKFYSSINKRQNKINQFLYFILICNPNHFTLFKMR